MVYDLEQRTKAFSKNVLVFLGSVHKTYLNQNIILQLSRSATSIGANYCEANNAVSRNDFKNKIYICKKETQETKYWLELLALSESGQKDKIKVLWNETNELALIFNKIATSLRKHL